MNNNTHPLLVGKIMSNLHSLEFAIRAKLHNHHKRTSSGNLNNMRAGDVVDVDEMTNYDSLATLIEKYNAQVANSTDKTLDRSIVAIRDALAHGRVSATTPTAHMRIIKFDKPANNKVRVAFSEEMNEEWLNDTIQRIYNELNQLI
jgi:hypothetical protein